jgi:hypothetical protein
MPPRNLLTGHLHEYIIQLLVFLLMFGFYWFYGCFVTFGVRPHSSMPDFGIRTKHMFEYPNPDIADVMQEMNTPVSPGSKYPLVLALAKSEYYGSMILFVLAFFNTFLPYRKKYIVHLVLVSAAVAMLIDFFFVYANYIGKQLNTQASVTIDPRGYPLLIGYVIAAIVYCIFSIATHADKKYSLQVERDLDWND